MNHDKPEHTNVCKKRLININKSSKNTRINRIDYKTRYIHDDTNDTHITQINEDKGVEFPIQVPMSLLPHCDATKVPLQGL